jgi:hypothetical protein
MLEGLEPGVYQVTELVRKRWTYVNDLGAVNNFRGIQHLVGQFQDAADGKAFARELEEMVVAVAFTKLKVIQCPMPVIFFFWMKLVRFNLALNGGVVTNH